MNSAREADGNDAACVSVAENSKETQQFAGKRIAVLRALKSDAFNVKEQHRSLGAPSAH